MPKKIKDDSGAEIEVYDKAEMDAATAAAVEAKAKELEQDINPNWKAARQTMAEKDAEIERLKKGEKPTPTTTTPDEVTRIAREQAAATYLERHRDRVIAGYGDKAEAVRKYYDKLSQGETLDEATVDRIADDAARAVGARRSPNPQTAAMYGREGAKPQFDDGSAEKGFGESKEGKTLANAMGIKIDKPNETK